MSAGDIVVLAGGTGGAKLARGIADAFGPERVTVIANTGDDIEIYGAHVSPDPDLVSFWLAGLIDERGWGIAGDSFEVMEQLRSLGEDIWFNLGDRDLAWCLRRAAMLAEGLTPTAALARLNGAIGQEAEVLPMCDEPVRTWIRSASRWVPFQEFMIRGRGAGPIEGVEFRGIEQARPSARVLEVLAHAHAVVIGPSNPIVSIGPILALDGMRAALSRCAAPLVAVSPIVEGEVLKGPTRAFMEHAGLDCTPAGVADAYGDLLDGLLADEDVATVPTHVADVRMSDASGRRRVAERVLELSESLLG